MIHRLPAVCTSGISRSANAGTAALATWGAVRPDRSCVVDCGGVTPRVPIARYCRRDVVYVGAPLLVVMHSCAAVVSHIWTCIHAYRGIGGQKAKGYG
jgi:hypothetical protein